MNKIIVSIFFCCLFFCCRNSFAGPNVALRKEGLAFVSYGAGCSVGSEKGREVISVDGYYFNSVDKNILFKKISIDFINLINGKEVDKDLLIYEVLAYIELFGVDNKIAVIMSSLKTLSS